MEQRLFLLLTLALGALAAGHTFQAQIIGGREAAPHSRPYMASLQKAGTHLCGGVLVHPRWVLTAAHCLAQPRKLLRLVLGLHAIHDPDDPGLPFLIKMAVLHPDYKAAPALQNDLALLKLDGKVKPSKTVQPLPLPRGSRAVPVGARCSVAGWGLTQARRLARALRELDVRVLDARMCNNSRFWSGAIAPHMFCLSAEAQHQAPCKGDSGGPLVCDRGSVAGILSFSSKACTDTFKPPVATAVAPYVSWIKKVIGRWRSPPQT
ncbi:granzyme M [Orycteropus afer afer]|uniref:Granzyme M n=1 Tax=Orycteropus afer afer TaxID=1230840 RepID=A0A8B7AXV6_ORYAF|nr:granzyme M [Orycteropus afer afer]